MAVNTDNITQFFEGIRDERRTHANTAQRIGNALLMLLALVEKQLDLSVYLRNDIDNNAKAVIGFEKGLKLGDGGVASTASARLCCDVSCRLTTTGRHSRGSASLTVATASSGLTSMTFRCGARLYSRSWR